MRNWLSTACAADSQRTMRARLSASVNIIQSMLRLPDGCEAGSCLMRAYAWFHAT